MKKTRHNPERRTWRGKSGRKAGNGPATAQRVRDLKDKEAQRVAERSAKPTDKFGVWKAKAALYAKTHPALCLDDILAPDDPYELAEAMPAAFETGQSPEEFIEEVFDEDITSREYDEHLANEAYEHELAELGLDVEGEPQEPETQEDEPCHFPPLMGCAGCAARLGDAARQPRRFLLVNDPKASSKSYWSGSRWTKNIAKAKRYSGHDGETNTKQMRRRGFAKASLIPDAAGAA